MSKSTLEVGKRLVTLCREAKIMQAIEELYSPDIVSVEAAASANMPQKQEGIKAVRGKAEWWEANHTVHRPKPTAPGRTAIDSSSISTTTSPPRPARWRANA